MASTNAIGNTTENDIMNLIFNATTWTGMATAGADANIDIMLSTGTLTDASDMSSTEATYTGYLRLSRPRTNVSGGWAAATTGVIQPHTTNIDFGLCSGSTNTITFFAVGKTGGGAGKAIFWWGDVTPNIAVSTGVTPRLTQATTIALD